MKRIASLSLLLLFSQFFLAQKAVKYNSGNPINVQTVSAKQQYGKSTNQRTTLSYVNKKGIRDAVLFSSQYWKKISEMSINETGERQIKPRKYVTVSLDIKKLQSSLVNAKKRELNGRGQGVEVELPDADGGTSRYLIFKNTTMSKGLEDKFPNIRTYDALSIDYPGEYGKIDITPHGFHGMIFSPSRSTFFIDPYQKGDVEHYIAYYKKDFTTNKKIECQVESEARKIYDGNEFNTNGANQRPLGSCDLRTYRLAVSATGEYTQFHGGTVALAQAAQVTTMNRVNGVFERDAQITMEFIPNNNLIVYTNPGTDPFTNGNTGAMINENQTNTDAVIGSANYDIGHIFGTNSGGLAQLFSPCTANKARGVTGSGAPVNDPFDIDYVAHEMGHQWGANHTQNNNCNRNNATAVEPGSASSIMGYAGICAPNVQSNSDDHFHGISVEEMSNYISGFGSSCAVQTAVTNSSPIITGTNGNVTIPANTPFALTATVTDPNAANVLSYCWEQMDNQVSTQPPVATSTGGPNFRSLSPTTNPTRYFPNLADLMAGGPFTWEVLSSVNRTMNFRVTVRDNAGPLPETGCIAQEDVTVTVDASSGPFVVTYPSATGITWTGATSETVTWNVAGTAGAPVSCATVDILLSTDGGLTFPTVLAAGVPNSGSQVVTVPNTPSTTCVIMVVCSNGTFFDISDNVFTIVASTFDYTLSSTPTSISICPPNDANYTINVGSIGGYNDPVTLSVSGVPAPATSSFSVNPVTPVGSSILNITNTGGVTPGSYPITITGNSTSGSKSIVVTLVVSDPPPTAVTLTTPANLATGVAMPVNFSWTAAVGAGVVYDIDIATDMAFTAIVDNAVGLATNSYVSSVLSPTTTYYWRVRAYNGCGTAPFSSTFEFTTSIPIGCDTLNFPPPGTLTVYSGGNGYVCGWNATYQDVSKAEYFSAASHTPYTHVTGGLFYIWSARDGGNGATVDFNVWDASGAGGSPGAILSTVTVPLSALDFNPTGPENSLVEILFPTPVNVGAADFYFGLSMNGFVSSGNPNNFDSLGVVSNTNGDTSPATAWEEWGAGSGGGWYAFDDPSSWGLGISQFMSPYMTDVPPTAVMNLSATTICEGDTINFDGTSSANALGYNWVLTGGTPSSSTNSVETSTYNTAGNYTEYLVVDGSCQSVAVDSVAITVNPSEDATYSYSASSYCSADADPTPTITGTGGGTFSSTPAGLTINSSTGTIDLSASTPNTYSILYTTPGPSCQDTMSVLVTIVPTEDATFSYSSASYCQSETDPTPTVTGTLGGSFTSSPVGLNMNGTTGTIDLSASTPNTYSILYTTPGPACQDTMSVIVTVTTGDDATFNYSAASYCTNDSDPTPTISGTGGGTFSSTPAGLSINAGTGTIDVSTSTANTYTVTYITPGPACPDTMNVAVTINTSEDATFSYSSTTYCTNEPDPIPTISGTGGGTFSINNGGVINSSNGTINISASGTGNFIVTYITPGPACPDTGTFNLSISNSDDATITPAGPYCENDPSVTLNAVDPGGTWSGIGITNPTTGVFNPSTAGVGNHQIIYTISGTCGDADTITIVVNAADDATFSYSAATYCVSGTDPTPTISGTGGGTFSSTPAGLTINNLTGTIDLSTSSANTYSVTYITPGPNCPDTLTVSVTITLAPNASFSYTGTPYCWGTGTATVTYAGGGPGVFSAAPVGLSINSSTGEVDLTLSTPGTYTVQNFIAASGGCAAAFATSPITIIAPDTATFNYSTTSFCPTDGDETPNVTGTTGGVFSSAPGGLVINAGTGTISPSLSTPNNYTVSYITTGSCPDTSTIAVTVNPSEDASFAYSSPAYCQSASNPTPTILGNPGGVFSSTPAGLSINSSTGTIALSTSTPNSYTVTYITGGPCPDTSTVGITVTPADDATFSYSATNYCQYDLDPTPTISGTGGGTFSSSPAGLSLNGITGLIDLSTSTPNTYIVTYTTIGPLCPDTFSVNVTVDPADDATFSYSAANYCQNDTDPIPTISGTGGGTFSSTPAGLNINSSTGIIDLSASTTNTYSVTYITSGICPDTQSVSVTINSAEDATFSYSAANYCQGDTDPTPTISGTGGGTFSSTPAGLSINSSTGEITLSSSTPNTYSVTYITLGALCPDTMSVSITINADEDATYSYSSNVYCNTDPDPTPTISGTGGGTFTSSPAGLSINGATGTIDVSASTPGVYSVLYTSPGPNCIDTMSITITINNCTTPPVANFSSSDSTLCIGDCISFTDLSTNVPTNWTWYFFGADSTTSNQQNPINICYNSAGTFDVALVVSNASGQDSLFMPGFITVNANPNVIANASTTNTCEGDTVTLTGSGATNYVWDNGVIDGIPILANTTTTYTVIGTDANGCSNSDNITVTVNPNPLIIAIGDTTICEDETVTISVSGASTYSWSNSLGSGDKHDVSPNTTTNYVVTGTDVNGCSATDTVIVTVDNSKCFNIPNVFSPNGDGKNDTWVLRGIEAYPDISVTIFNRWGGEMYKSTGYDDPWDGSYNGSDSPSATYYYIIDLGDGQEPISGTVNIIR